MTVPGSQPRVAGDASTTPTRATRARTRSRRTRPSRAAPVRTAIVTSWWWTATSAASTSSTRARPQADGSWHAGSGAIFDLRSNALRPARWTSADAAGLPILPGLARYDEVAAGEIRHALRFTAPRNPRAYVWPARHFASSLTDPACRRMGQRFRLKAAFDLRLLAPEVRVILAGLQAYGMILADNGSDWYISGVPDPRWDNDGSWTRWQVRGTRLRGRRRVRPDGRSRLRAGGGGGPGLSLTANQASFRPGETLRVAGRAHNDGPAVAVDFYFAVRLPDGVTVLFLQSLTAPSFVPSRLDARPEHVLSRRQQRRAPHRVRHRPRRTSSLTTSPGPSPRVRTSSWPRSFGRGPSATGRWIQATS